MSTGTEADIFLSDESETTRLGAAIAPTLLPGDTILLSGPIGSGKTHLARAIIQSRLGRAEDVPSPTYTIVQTYDDGICEIWHADLYRISEPFEIIELGLEDAMIDCITLIEWPDRLPDHPANALSITFRTKDEGRVLHLSSTNPKWAGLYVPNP